MVTQWPALISHAELNANGAVDPGEKVIFLFAARL